MPLQRLKEYLNDHDVPYVTVAHSPAYTANEIAATAHIKGKDLAKTVMVKMNGKMAMAVLPASERVDLEALRNALGVDRVELAMEDEFKDLFPGCEVGAMPPFGNLFDLPVYVASDLAEDEEIAFNAGNHHELIRLRYADFERLVQPNELQFGVHI